MQEDGFVAEHEDAKEDPIYEYARTQHLYAEGIEFENIQKMSHFCASEASYVYSLVFVIDTSAKTFSNFPVGQVCLFSAF